MSSASAATVLFFFALRGSKAPESKPLQLTPVADLVTFDVALADEIAEGLFLGGQWAAKNFKALQQTGITHILTVAPIPPTFPDHFTYKVCEVEDDDSEDLLSRFDELHDFITDALDNDGKVLVHCHAGASRSSTIVISYLMRRCGFSWDFALSYCVERRAVVCPNEGFLQQLDRFQEILKSR